MKTTKSPIPLLKAVLIDFDGTMADSIPALYQCYLLFLDNHGIKGTKNEFNALIGPPLPTIVSILKEKHRLHLPVSTLLSEYRSLIGQSYLKSVRPHPYVKEALSYLKNRGLRLAIVTSAPSAIVKQFLVINKMDLLVETVISAKKNEPSKPHPAIYLRTLQKLELTADEAVAIEDSPGGCAAAKAAGITTLQFSPQMSGTKKRAGSTKTLSFKTWEAIFRYLQLSFQKASEKKDNGLSDV